MQIYGSYAQTPMVLSFSDWRADNIVPYDKWSIRSPIINFFVDKRLVSYNLSL